MIQKLMTWEAFLYSTIKKHEKIIGFMDKYLYIALDNLLVDKKRVLMLNLQFFT
jgi:hypothetical protein